MANEICDIKPVPETNMMETNYIILPIGLSLDTLDEVATTPFAEVFAAMQIAGRHS